ncbi:MAG: efflux RND transporter periplasmic adaptor subunit [Phycisphaerales bacterium]|nr:efflux RND transporter periplasmic adaptor subunit [Phycisphaerales bacterium]
MGKLWRVLKWTTGIGLAVLLIGGGIAVFLVPKVQQIMREQAEKARGEAVVVESASRGALVRTISAPGTVTPTTEVNISARVSARIAELPKPEGSTVKRGDVLVQLDAKELEAALAASEARLLADRSNFKAAEATLASEEARMLEVRATLDKATADFERQSGLYKSGDVSKSQLESFKADFERARAAYQSRAESLNTVRANVEAARARVLATEAEVKQSRENLSYATIVSPIDGFVTQLNAKVGEIVVVGTMNNAGTVIMKVADLSEMLVKARLAEMDVPRVKAGQPAKVNVNGFPDTEFRGTLRRVGLQSRTATGEQSTFFEGEVVLHLSGSQRVFAGSTANVDIEVETIENSVMVPSQAVQDRRVEDLPESIRLNDANVDRQRTFARVVFVLDGGKARVRPVKVSASNLTQTALAGGLEPGERVIVGPFKVLQTLTDGKDVRVADGQGAATTAGKGGAEKPEAEHGAKSG